MSMSQPMSGFVGNLVDAVIGDGFPFLEPHLCASNPPVGIEYHIIAISTVGNPIGGQGGAKPVGEGGAGDNYPKISLPIGAGKRDFPLFSTPPARIIQDSVNAFCGSFTVDR